MNCHTIEDVKKAVADHKVAFIQFWFTDILGILKSFTITPTELDEGLTEGMGFDGSPIEGFARIEESDLVAKPVPETFQIIPWANGDKPIARMFCDVLNPDGTPYEGDPRYILKKNLLKLQEKGLTYFVGPELEYFYFINNQEPEPIDSAGYFDSQPIDQGDALRRITCETLQKMGIRVEYSHHEVAHSQHEIDLRYSDALTMADTCMTYRVIVKELAHQHNLYATFMPKPMFRQNGSGMHVHQFLFNGNRNAFYDASDKYHLSVMAKHYIAGIMTHAKEIIAVTNLWVNSYKRLVPGYEAPVYISWARRNRSAMIRVPMYKPGKEQATRIEFRAPDPAANPYLAFSVMLAAGLKGVEEKYELPDPVEEDIYEMTPAERAEKGIKELPGDLYSAIIKLERSELVRETLGDHVFNKFVANKKIEWDRFRVHVSRFEVDKYLPIL